MANVCLTGIRSGACGGVNHVGRIGLHSAAAGLGPYQDGGFTPPRRIVPMRLPPWDICARMKASERGGGCLDLFNPQRHGGADQNAGGGKAGDGVVDVVAGGFVGDDQDGRVDALVAVLAHLVDRDAGFA